MKHNAAAVCAPWCFLCHFDEYVFRSKHGARSTSRITVCEVFIPWHCRFAAPGFQYFSLSHVHYPPNFDPTQGNRR